MSSLQAAACAIEQTDEMSKSRSAALNSSIVQTLKRRIIAWEYPPEYRLVEERLCEEFGVSRSPVREALRVLATNGFVKKLPNRGYAVRQSVGELVGAEAARRAGGEQQPDDVAQRALKTRFLLRMRS